MIFTFACLLHLTRSIQLGSIDGYFSISEAKILLNELVSNNSAWMSQISDNIYRINSGDSIEKTKILVLGGFFAGFPQGNLQVMFNIQKLIEDINQNYEIKELMKGILIDFFVFPNELAYNKSITKNNETGEYEVKKIFLDQVNYFSSCEGSDDFGINPDMNFPELFAVSGDWCSGNFSGLEANSSVVTQKIIGMVSEYKVIVNYQSAGNYYSSPYAGSKSPLQSSSSSVLISEIFKDAKSLKYNTNSLSNLTNSLSNGTLMDYASSLNKTFLQISLGSYNKLTSKSSLNETSSSNYNIFLYGLISRLSSPKIKLLKATESPFECNSTCNFTQIVNISLLISNFGLVSRSFELEANISFSLNSNYVQESGSIIFRSLSDNTTSNDSIELFTNNRIFYNKSPIESGSDALVSIIFYRYEEEENDVFNISYRLSPKEGFFSQNLTFEQDVKIEKIPKRSSDSSDNYSNDTKVGLGVGLGLGILVVILVIICVYKYKKGRKHESNQI